MLYFLSLKNPTLQFLTSVIGMSLFYHPVLFMFWIQTTVCHSIIFQDIVVVELWKYRHHRALSFYVHYYHLYFSSASYFISYGYTGSVFHILKQLGILHILLAALCSAVVLTPSHRSEILSYFLICEHSQRPKFPLS
jgi:hypothetical protein